MFNALKKENNFLTHLRQWGVVNGTQCQIRSGHAIFETLTVIFGIFGLEVYLLA